jgi:hypothetical protein
VARIVSAALEHHGVRAVLTGGACATIHSRGAYASTDLDYIVQGTVTRQRLDSAMRSAGFERDGARYVHPDSRFFVEFPAGPLAIGDDDLIEPVKVTVGRGRLLALSATDSCRDRLAAFFYWNDRQSLRAAAAIAVAKRVDMAVIRRWSVQEGNAERFQEFAEEARRLKSRKKHERPGVSARTRRSRAARET